jgi:hypothetical protein
MENNQLTSINYVTLRGYVNVYGINSMLKNIYLPRLNIRTIKNFIIASGSLELMQALENSQNNESLAKKAAKEFDIHPSFLDPSYAIQSYLRKYTIENYGCSTSITDLTAEESDAFLASHCINVRIHNMDADKPTFMVKNYAEGDSICIYEQRIMSVYKPEQNIGMLVEDEFKTFTAGYYSRYEFLSLEALVTKGVQIFELLKNLREARVATLQHLDIRYKTLDFTNQRYIDFFQGQAVGNHTIFPEASRSTLDFVNEKHNRVDFLLNALYADNIHIKNDFNQKTLLELASMTSRLRSASKYVYRVHLNDNGGYGNGGHSKFCPYCIHSSIVSARCKELETKIKLKESITYEKIIMALDEHVTGGILKDMENYDAIERLPINYTSDSDAEYEKNLFDTMPPSYDSDGELSDIVLGKNNYFQNLELEKKQIQKTNSI